MHPILVSKFAVFPLRWWIFFTFLLSLSVYTITFLLFTYRVSDKPCVDSGRGAAPRVFKQNNLFNECDRPSTRTSAVVPSSCNRLHPRKPSSQWSPMPQLLVVSILAAAGLRSTTATVVQLCGRLPRRLRWPVLSSFGRGCCITVAGTFPSIEPVGAS